MGWSVGSSPAEWALWREYDRLEALPAEQFMRAFMRLNVKPGVEAASAARRSAAVDGEAAGRDPGVHADLQDFQLDREALARFDRPVYFGLGGPSNPDQFGAIATRLSRVFPDFQLEVFEQRHHFDPPHRVEPERLAASLRALWQRADQE